MRALAQETIHQANRGNRGARAAQRCQDLALDLAQRVGHPNPRGRALVAAGTAALMQGRWKPAVELLEEAETLLKDHCAGLDFELHLAQFHALLARQKLGSLRDLEIRLSAQLQAAQDKGDLLALTNLRTGVSPQVHLAHDDPERALREAQQAIGEWSTSGFHTQHYHALVAQVEALLYAAGRKGARTLLAAHWQLPAPFPHAAGAERAHHLPGTPGPGDPGPGPGGVPGSRGRRSLLRAADRDILRLERERSPTATPWPCACGPCWRWRRAGRTRPAPCCTSPNWRSRPAT